MLAEVMWSVGVSLCGSSASADKEGGERTVTVSDSLGLSVSGRNEANE